MVDKYIKGVSSSDNVIQRAKIKMENQKNSDVNLSAGAGRYDYNIKSVKNDTNAFSACVKSVENSTNNETIINFEDKEDIIELDDSFENFEVKSNLIEGKKCIGTYDFADAAKVYNLSDSEVKKLYALVYAEAGIDKEYRYSDAMGVASLFLNRLESDEFPNTFEGVLTETYTNNGVTNYQFNGYQSEKYKEFMNGNADETLSSNVIRAVDRVLAGERNTDGLFFIKDKRYPESNSRNKFRKEYKEKVVS